MPTSPPRASGFVPAPLIEIQRRNNEATAAGWELFAPHRAQVTRLLTSAGGGSLCILGAGNLNDVDAPALVAAFDEVHLADLDAAALARGCERLPAAARDRLQRHAPVDLSGVMARLSRWHGTDVSPGQIDALPGSAADAVHAALGGRMFDVVASTGLLSQLLQACGRAVGVKHRQLRAIAGAVVAAHLRTLAALTRPGGTAFLVTDVVSSETFPLEELWDDQPPEALLDRLSREGNCFTGVDPAFVGRVIHEHPAVRGAFGEARLHTPWLWTLSADLTVMVYALELARGPQAPK